MALTFPRDMTSGRCWDTADLSLMRRQEIARTAGAATQVKDMGPALWVATYETYPLRYDDAQVIHADFLSLGGAARPFYLVPARARLPRKLTGSLFGSISDIRADRGALNIGGLSEGRIARGDYLSIQPAGGGRELHVVTDGTDVPAGGSSGRISVEPPLRPAVKVGDTAGFREPTVEMILRPGTLTMTRESLRRWRVGFEAVQVVR